MTIQLAYHANCWGPLGGNAVGVISITQLTYRTFGDMAKAIDAACGIDYFYDLKKRSWAALNSYTHTGNLQLGRRFTGDRLNPSYKDGEKIEVIRTGTTMLLLIVRPFLAKHGHKKEAVQIDEIGKSWAASSKKF